MAQSPAIRLHNVAIKGLKVMLLDAEIPRAREYEAQSEFDPELLRIDLYTAETVREAADLIRAEKMDLAILPDQLNGRDFVDMQLEFKAAHPSIDLIPLLTQPTIRLISQARRIGVFDFAEATTYDSYDKIKALILSYAREHLEGAPRLKEMFRFAQTLQRALSISQHADLSIKELSRQAMNLLLLEYDFSSVECALFAAAEQAYFPQLRTLDYEWLAESDSYGLVQVLTSTGSWQHLTTPSSAAGLVITAANFMAHGVHAGNTEMIQTAVAERAIFLRHPAIRVLSPALVQHVLASLSQRTERIAV